MPNPVTRTLRGVQRALGFGVVSIAPNDSGPVQTMQVRMDSLRTFEEVPVAHHFGFSSVAPIGSNVIHQAAQGDSSKGVVTGSVHPASRVTGLTPGQSAFYDQSGSRLTFTNDSNGTIAMSGTLTMQFGSTAIAFSAAGIFVNGGTIHATGTITSDANLVSGTTDFNGHEHTVKSLNAPTTPPIVGT